MVQLREMKRKETAKKVEDGAEETLTDCGFPSGHWTQLRTNNVIERLNREIRRRTRGVGPFRIAKLLIGQPRHFRTLRDVVKALEAKPVLLKFHSEVGNNDVRRTPQGDISCVLRSYIRDVTVITLTGFQSSESSL